MATWQAAYWLVPMEEDVIRPEHAWVGIEHVTELLPSFNAVLPRTESWSPDMLHWGDYESHDVQVWLEHGIVAGIQVRIDLRQPDIAGLLAKLAEVGMTIGAAFRDGYGIAIMPDAAMLSDSVTHSSAASFVSSPASYLAEIRDQPG